MKDTDGYVAIPKQAKDKSHYGPCGTLEALIGLLLAKGIMPGDIVIFAQYDGKRGNSVHENIYSQPVDKGKGRIWLPTGQISEKPNTQ